MKNLVIVLSAFVFHASSNTNTSNITDCALDPFQIITTILNGTSSDDFRIQ